MKKLTQLYNLTSFQRAAMMALIGLTIIGKTNANEIPKDPTETQWIEKKKNITFSYSITPADKISLENQFGDIKVSFWDKNEVKIEVLVLANAASEERASNFIHMVDVVGKKAEGEVKIKTVIDREEGNYKNNTWNWKGGTNDKNSLKIDFYQFATTLFALIFSD
jgi:hypothetical protein